MPGRVARTLSVTALLWLAVDLTTTTTRASDVADPSTVQPAERITPPARSFSLIATGDVLTENAVNFAAARITSGTGARYDFAPLLAPIAAMISSADIAICHMELPIGRPGDRAGIYGRSHFGGNLLLAPYEIASAIARTGFDRCSTASNHSNDLGEPSIGTTLAALDAAGLTHVGTARAEAEAATALLTVNGVQLAHLSYTRYSNTTLPSEPWRVNFAATAGQVAADVDAARLAGAEVVVVSIHVFQELLPAPLPADRAFIDDVTRLARIDLVVEHGPHVVQPVEKVNGTWVYWSVGNLISGMGTPGRGVFADPRTLDGLAATARFSETSPGVFSVDPWPVLVCNEPFGRAVYAPIATLANLTISSAVRTELLDCIARTIPVVPDLH
jgi:Bacterial capsule synthesis protein PGA_cap